MAYMAFIIHYVSIQKKSSECSRRRWHGNTIIKDTNAPVEFLYTSIEIPSLNPISLISWYFLLLAHALMTHRANFNESGPSLYNVYDKKE